MREEIDSVSVLADVPIEAVSDYYFVLGLAFTLFLLYFSFFSFSILSLHPTFSLCMQLFRISPLALQYYLNRFLGLLDCLCFFLLDRIMLRVDAGVTL